MEMVCGPGLYQPTHTKTLAASESTSGIVRFLLPSDPLRCVSHLWHNDLREENIFVGPTDPTKILGIIDWQSTQVAPLFEQAIDPGILDFEGPDIESLEQPKLPDNYNELPAVEKAAEVKQYCNKALLVAYRRMIQKNIPPKTAIAKHPVRSISSNFPGASLKLAKRICRPFLQG